MQTGLTQYYEYRQEDIDYLKNADELLGAAIDRLGRVERPITPDLFVALVHAIVGQLISVKAAQTVLGRLLILCGEISPAIVLMLNPEDIQKCGMSMKKAVCIHHIARMIVEGAFHLDELHDLSDVEVIKRLIALHGIGQWTAEMLLIHSMQRPDVVSWGDIAIRRGMMKLYGLSTITKAQFEQYRLRYSPFGSLASLYLWEISSE